MNHRFHRALVVLTCLGLFSSTQALGSSARLSFCRGSEQTVVLRLSALRSAYLIRAGAVSYDETDGSPAGIRRQLQDHFHVVLALLHASTSTSIETALNRLEASQSTAWSASDRATWRGRLLAARFFQLQRLTDYRERGLFPINEGQALDPVPIFVDGHDTACAVGHLMRLSGHRSAVVSIATSDNFIHVPDVVAGPIADWILTSGLTLEEAALVQPAYGHQYGPEPVPADAVQVVPGWSGSFGDLRYSNFRIFREADGVDIPSVNIPVLHTFCGIGLMGCFNLARLEPGELDLDANSDWYGPEYNRVVVQFDVDVLSPMQRIVGRTQASTFLTTPLPRLYDPNRIALFVSGDQSRLYIDQATDGLKPSDDLIFVPIPSGPDRTASDDQKLTQHLTIVTELLLRNWQFHQAQIMRFQVVTIPEPATCLLLAICTTVMAAGYRFRRSPRSNAK